MVSILIVLSVFAPLIAPNDPIKVDMNHRLIKFSRQYPLGTDQLGRCILSRLLYGMRVTLIVSILVLFVTIVIGTTAGIIAGLSGGIVDRIVMSFCEILLAFPAMILALCVCGLLGPGIMNIMLAIALVSWCRYARVVRSAVYEIKEADYIKAARVVGTSNFKIVMNHIIPNIASTIATMAVTDIGSTIMRISGLSFLGLGAQAPHPEWGMMINEGRLFMDSAPWLVVYPTIAAGITILAFNLIGDGMRDKIDPTTY